MSAGGPHPYRFGPRDRRGLIAGVRTAQLVIVTSSLGVAVGLLRAVSGAGRVGALLAPAAGAALAFWPVAGRTLDEWVPVVAGYASGGVLGRRRVAVLPAARPADRRPPPLFRSFSFTEAGAAGRRFGVVVDGARNTASAALVLGGEAFALLGEEERSRRAESWAAVLAAAANDVRALHRLQWIERTVPDHGAAFRAAAARALSLVGSPGGNGGNGATPSGPLAAAAFSYAGFVADETCHGLRHEVLVVVTTSGTGARGDRLPALLDLLAGEVAMLEQRLRDAGLSVEGVLSLAGLRRAVARTFDAAGPHPDPAWPWPLAVESAWAALRTDACLHATYWIAEWPRTDVGNDFLLPLLGATGERRSVSVVMAPVAPLRAVRAAEHARTASAADVELRRRHGFALTARSHREQEAVLRREHELAEGHAAYRFAGYLTVSAPGQEALERSCARVEQAAALARLELRRCYGSQAEAFCFALPLGRGCP